jgi:hypothetical protein
MSVRQSAKPVQSILSPTVDFLCSGGLALIVLVPLLAIGPENLTFVQVGWALWAQTLINSAHFMASYRIVYRDKSTIMRHKWAAIWVPLILILVALVGVTVQSASDWVLTGFFSVASAYLAWHYTGQVFGMMASYTFLGGDRFELAERRLFKWSLRILLAWHVSWFLHIAMRHPEDIEPVYLFLGKLNAVAALLGIIGLTMFRRRTGHLPPARAIAPWVAIFFWYAAMAKWGIAALFFVQLFHSIQYLEFPTRVEINRATAVKAGKVTTSVALWAAGLAAASILMVLLVPNPAMSIVSRLFDVPTKAVGPIFVLYFINIHHYFTDGVIWKISNPEVRKELFAHVAKPVTAAVAESPVGHPSKKGRPAAATS